MRDWSQTRRTVALAVVLVALWLGYMAIPAFEGYHLGFNADTDNVQITRLGVQWGRYDAACVGLPQGSRC